MDLIVFANEKRRPRHPFPLPWSHSANDGIHDFAARSVIKNCRPPPGRGGGQPGKDATVKISRITAYQVDLPLREGAYSWAGHSFAAFDSTVVLIETDEGLTGAGETCPLGPAYLPAYAEGARAGLAKLAPGLIGQDPLEIDRINHLMERLLKGHPYVKSAVDMACWDLAGQACGQPLYKLLGGKFQDRVKLFKVLSRDEPDVMAAKAVAYREQGFRQFQMKVGDDPALDIRRLREVVGALTPDQLLGADANTGWRQHEAQRVAAAAERLAAESGVPIYLEQPCLTYAECLAVRRNTKLPMILDECMDSLGLLIRGHGEQAMDLVNLKINRLGGLTRARQFRDLAVELGIVMTIEDSWGGEIATAAIAHLAHSTPEGFHFQSSAFHDYSDLCIAAHGPEVKDGYMTAPDRPGLGIAPILEALGPPVFEVR